jgi:membrane protease subunit HflK
MESKGPHVIDIRNLQPSKIPIRGVLGGILVVVIVALAFSMFFTVEAEQVGMILRFGKFIESKEPGFHFKLPYPIESVTKVAVQRQLKAEFGFRTQRAGVRSEYSSAGFIDESLMLTGDLNVAEVEWISQFRITDPYKFLFKVRRMEETFRHMNEAVMRQVIGDRSVNEVLTTGRQEIADEAKLLLQKLCDQYETGIRVDQIVLQNVTPPDEVKPSFNEVNQAQQEKERRINEARSLYNKIIPKAQGEAERTIQTAEGYATDRVNRAQGDVAAFSALLEAYRRSPDVTRRRMYLETMSRIYPKVQRKVIIDKDMKGLLPLLNLGGESK